ncbi:hypothetical protein NQZ68_040450 [Dissostichus eleginoides]|nr:hypothetical protein NQZ68_040450 [Dissostichus eleginoides]
MADWASNESAGVWRESQLMTCKGLFRNEAIWPHLLPLQPLDLQEHPLPRPLILQEHPLPRPLIQQEHLLPRPLILQEHPLPRPLIQQEHPLPRPLILQEHLLPRPPLPRPLILQEHPLPRPPLPRPLILQEHPLPGPPLPGPLILKEHPLPRPPLPGPPLKLQDQPLPPYPHLPLYLWTLMNSFNDFLIDDSDEEEEGKDEAFGALEIDVFPVEEVDLAVLLSDFKKDFVSDGLVSSICIRRKKLLESAIKAISRVTFCWNNSPYIEFVGEDGDDMGGPQREFFRLLMIEVQTSMGIFEGKAGQVFLTYDQAALDGHKYFQAGRLIAWSVAHGGPCIKALDPSLYQLMCGQEPQLEQFDCSVLPDPDVQSRCKTAEDLSALQKDLGDWISECGVPGIFSATIGEIPKIYAYVVKHYIFLRTAKMVNQLTEGMNAFGNLWDLVRNNWIAFLPCFTNMRTPLTKSSFKAILKYEYSPRGTNHREKEEDTIYSWELVLNIEDKLTELTFEDLLIFITGADEVPTLGFPNKPSIDFYTQEAGMRRLPYASTCAMTLFLPRGITEEQELHNILNQRFIKRATRVFSPPWSDLTLDGNPYRQVARTKWVNTVKAVLYALII